MRLHRVLGAAVAAALLLAAAPAQADTWFTPYLGTNTSTDYGGFDPGGSLHFGASIAWLKGAAGLEIDISHAPNFFEPDQANQFFDFTGTGNVTTLMANLIVAPRFGAFQPYGSGGVGLLRTRIETPVDLVDFSDNNFGMNIGGGLRLGGRSLAVRGDVRYFRQFADVTPISSIQLGDFSYWRSTVGVSFGF